MRKLLTACLALAMLLSMVSVGAVAQDRPLIEVTVFRSYTPSPEYDDTMYVEFVRDMFNLQLNYEYAPSSSVTEKLQLSFATNSYADVVELVSTDSLKLIAKDGFLHDLNPYLDNELANYRAVYTDSQWDTMYKENVLADGGFYFLPQKMAGSATSSNVWMWRRDQFEALGMELPVTTDDFLAAMRAFKAENPSTTIPNRWGLWNALEGFNIAFRTTMFIFRDPDTGMVEFGPETDKFRDLMIFMHTLYAEDILNKEFITMSDEQRYAEFSQGNVYANFQFPGAEAGLNYYQGASGLAEDWVVDYDHLLLTAYPELGPTQQEWALHLNYGIAITDRVDAGSEKMARILEYLNWSCSIEGQLFHEYGVEGLSYSLADGVATFLPYPGAENEEDPTWYSPLFNNGPFGYYLAQNEKSAAAAWPTASIVNEALDGVEMAYQGGVPVELSKDEETRLGDLALIVHQTQEEWMQDFILGVKDPSDDTQWENYLKALRSVGMDEYVSLYRLGYERIGGEN